MHLVGYFHSCITMHGFTNVIFLCTLSLLEDILRPSGLDVGKIWGCSYSEYRTQQRASLRAHAVLQKACGKVRECVLQFWQQWVRIWISHVISSVPPFYVSVTTGIDNSRISSPLPHFLPTFLLNYLPSDYTVDAAVHYTILQQCSYRKIKVGS